MTEQHDDQHQKRQQKLKQAVDARIENAQIDKRILLVITGNGKGKTTAGFGTILRALGHGQSCGVAQFIKGTWDNPEKEILSKLGVPFYVMATGFTWETQNKETDRAAAQAVWQSCLSMLQDPSIDLILFDELTYMITYGYIDLDEVITALENRPAHQSVIITGRAAHRRLTELADTVSEVRPVKHAFDQGIQARLGVDY
ncbi:MAG: cob(I)yrinic acid a,c-diamide adenosyltransferase [Vibrio sp.]